MRLVMIEWIDSSSAISDRRWHGFDEIKSVAPTTPCKSVGWLLDEKSGPSGYKCIVPHITEEEFGLGDMSIPNKAIIKITVLRK